MHLKGEVWYHCITHKSTVNVIKQWLSNWIQLYIINLKKKCELTSKSTDINILLER